MNYDKWIARSSRTMTSNNTGFTLAEVLVFMTAGFLVVSAAYALYHVGQASFTSGLAVAEINQNARVAIDHLKNTINRAEPHLYGWYARTNGLNCVANGTEWVSETPGGTVLDGSLIKKTALKSMWTGPSAIRDTFEQTWTDNAGTWTPELDDYGHLKAAADWAWTDAEVQTGWSRFASWGQDIAGGGKTTWEHWWDNGLSAWKQFGEEGFEDNFWTSEVWGHHFPDHPGFQWSSFGVAAQNGFVYFAYTGSNEDRDTHYFRGEAYYFTQEAYFTEDKPPTMGQLYHYAITSSLNDDGTVTNTAWQPCLLTNKLTGCTFTYVSLSGETITLEEDRWKPLTPDGIGYVKVDLNFYDFNDANGDGKQDVNAKHLEETRASLDIHLSIRLQNIKDL